MESAIIVVPSVTEIVQSWVCDVIFDIHDYMRACADLDNVPLINVTSPSNLKSSPVGLVICLKLVVDCIMYE
jgi:hypothetical protein